MPAASTMTGGRALLLCTNTDNCIYQSVNGLQCCWLEGEGVSIFYGAPAPRGPGGAKSASIRDKISQWEGKKEVTPLNSTGTLLQTTTQKEVEAVKKKETKASEVQRTDSKRFVSREKQDSGKENVGKRSDSKPKSPACPTNKDKELVLEKSFRITKPTEQPQEKKTVLTHIKKLEKATKDVPDRPSLAFPGNYFSPPSKEEVEETEKKLHEPIFGTFDVARPGRSQRRKGGDPENVYNPPPKENPYEDIEMERSCLQTKCVSPSSSSPVPDTPTKLPSKPGFFRQTSERRSFKLLELRKINRDAGISTSSRISPPSTPSSPDDTPCLSGDPYNRRRRKIPKVVLKINAIFEARRGKKRMKKVSQSTEYSSGRVTDENSESESDTEEKLKAHSLRLVSVQSMLRQTDKCRTLERDLMELQERKLFEYFIVVALHKTKAGVPYLPEVTQQFPLKLERSFKFMRETEDQLKVIPQFCFPDAKDWAPVDSFPSETFSFVLTGEDGSRRFGYCRRLLPSGKGRRLPEVYCIVSRLGCFDLFSKILDEVEKRRAISPALVQPFMRGIMEAPFPAPGRTITVKNFLPGSGTEVIELCRPSDSRLEHVDFECLFSSLSLRLLLRVFASLLLERRVIFTADKLSTLSQVLPCRCGSALPFHLAAHLHPRAPPIHARYCLHPHPLHSGPPLQFPASTQRAAHRRGPGGRPRQQPPTTTDCSFPSTVISEAFVRFFVEIVGHYSLFLAGAERDDESLTSPTSPSPSSSNPTSSPPSSSFQREAFRKAVTSKSLRRFLEVFMETQMFTSFIQERDLRRQGLRGLFEMRAQEYLDSLPGSEQRGVNKFLKGLGNKMKFLSKK
ncbi:hypothetical protein fugu_011617 [Takifugu bimaculatus]|uniref:UDENN domain-containing protein n=1 Tax=Takifugu bimaculatus TaxID=433685 RepID=A0A4Z2C8D2_9TELE|nr:hypothetical protein fugu_011617 [Takifugu bimaculatus]